ncbi:MAG: ATP synthase F1 subunit epsilon [Lachnospiraceae bacterium]|nr:ATP synthase F1 subunit epsilon [Lachnospiraceae bacterium]
MNTFQLSIFASDRIFYEGPCESLILPAQEGSYGVQAGHCNMIAAVYPGELSYRVPGEELKIAAVSEGMVKIENNQVLVLVDTAEHPEEIDLKRVQLAADHAREVMLQKQQVWEYRTAQAQLSRAIARMKVRSDSLK